MSDCQKKILFVQITHLKFTFLTLDDKLLLVPNQLQDSNFLFEINSVDIGISIVSQSKLLSNLFELKENDSIVYEHHYQKNMSRNRSLLTSKVGKIVRLLLLSQATNARTDGIFFALNRVKTYLSSNVGVCSQ